MIVEKSFEVYITLPVAEVFTLYLDIVRIVYQPGSDVGLTDEMMSKFEQSIKLFKVGSVAFAITRNYLKIVSTKWSMF